MVEGQFSMKRIHHIVDGAGGLSRRWCSAVDARGHDAGHALLPNLGGGFPASQVTCAIR